MQSLQSAEEAAYRSLVRALQLDNPTWEAETVLSDARKLLRIDDTTHEAMTREVSRDPEIKALRAGKMPSQVNHSHPAAMGGILSDSAGPVGPPNGMGMVGGGMPPQPHGHVHTMDNRGRRPQPKPGDKRTSAGMHAGVANGTVQRMPQSPHMHAHPSMELMGHPQPPQIMHTGANGMANGAAMMPPPAMHAPARPMMMSQQYAAPALSAVGAAAGGHNSAPSSARGSKGHLQRRHSDDTNDSGDGTRSGGKGGKGGKKGRNARQRAFEAACPAELRTKLQDAELQGLVIERHWEREGWCKGIIAHSVKRKGQQVHHVIYDLDSASVAPTWELNVALSVSQAGEKWRIPNPPTYIKRNWKNIIPPESGKKAQVPRPKRLPNGQLAPAAPQPIPNAPAGAAAGGVPAAAAPDRMGAGAMGAMGVGGANAQRAKQKREGMPAAVDAGAAGGVKGGIKPEPGVLIQPVTATLPPVDMTKPPPQALDEAALMKVCKAAEGAGGSNVLKEKLEAVRARRAWVLEAMALKRVARMRSSAGPSAVRRRLESELQENRNKQRRLSEQLATLNPR